MTLNDLFKADIWLSWLAALQSWFYNSFATRDTLIELSVIAAAAAIAWPLSTFMRRGFRERADRESRSALLKRLWRTLSRVSFPLVWLMLQFALSLLISELEFSDGTIVVTSSLLMAWIIINVVAVFVANPLASNTVAFFAWLVAALNIVGLLDSSVALLDSTALKFGQFNVSALTLVKGFIALAALLWVTRLVGQLVEVRIKSSPNLTPSIQVLSTKLLRIGLAVAAFIFALSVVGIDLTALAVFGGAVGVGLGFGLQKIFANLISGFILLLDKSIKPGDVIAVSDNYGRVDSLGARYVSVLTRDGIEHLIPNEELITARVENWSHTHNMLRLRKKVGVHYKSDLRLAMQLCQEAFKDVPRILRDPAPVCLLTDFGDSSVDIEMRFWIDDPMNGRGNVISPLLLSIWDKFAEHNIEIPYPQRDLHVRSVENGLLPGVTAD